MAGWNPLAGAADTIEGLIAVLGDAGNARVILFTLVIGSVIGLIQATGGFSGFVEWVEKKNWVTSARGSRLLAWVLGVVIFIESNITVLVSGSVARPLFDRYRISREKLAYLIDSTSAPICILIPLNAWGAFVLGLLSAEGVAQPIVLFGQAIAFNFYAIASVILAGSVAFWGLSWGPMRRAERRVQEGTLHAEGSIPAMDVDDLVPKGYEKAHGPARLAIVPVLVLIVMMPVGLWIAGEGDLTASGIGSIAVLWAVSAALASLWIMLLLGRRNRMDVGALSKITMKGASGLLGLATILLFALALARVAGEMGTGVYLAGVVDDALPMFLLPALTFLVCGRDRFLDRDQLGHLRDHDPHRRPGGRDARHPPGSPRRGRALRRDLRRPLLADQRHYHHLVDGGGGRSHRARAHPASLCDDCGRGCARRLSPRRPGYHLSGPS
jgi:tetracycline resistance efflux pump